MIASLVSMLESERLIYVFGDFVKSWAYPQGLFRVCSGHVQSIFRVFSESVQSMFRVCSEYAQIRFRVGSE